MRMKAAAIGTFDGVHRGHRSVIETLLHHAQENNLEPVAFTFSNHPLSLIDPQRVPRELTPLNKKKKLLAETGVSAVVLDFDPALRATTARQWLKRLHDEFGVKALVLGYDSTFGSDGLNLSIEDLRSLGKKEGIEVLIAPEIKDVSSSAIRRAVAEGEMEKAREMLGRPFSLTAVVEHGNALGHAIGYPTANIRPLEGMAIPKPGVYAAMVKILSTGEKVPAMVNIGTRPTVMRGDDYVIEAHLINWHGDLYDKEITVRFLKRLRDEHKFDSIEALRKQLDKDRSQCLTITKDKD